MFPTFLITFREVIEAALIVSVIFGILGRLNQKGNFGVVWLAVFTAFILSVLLVTIGSIAGIKIHDTYEKYEEYIEGFFMILSVIFITWTVLFLHKYFLEKNLLFDKKLKKIVEKNEQRGIFFLVFTAVFREGLEIVIFLSTIYLSTNPKDVLTGFLLGVIIGLLLSFIIFKITQKLPITYALNVTNILLILFSAGLLIRGIHEFMEVKLIPEFGKIALPFIPPDTTPIGGIIKSAFGITNEINVIQITLYILYVIIISRLIFLNKTKRM